MIYISLPLTRFLSLPAFPLEAGSSSSVSAVFSFDLVLDLGLMGVGPDMAVEAQQSM